MTSEISLSLHVILLTLGSVFFKSNRVGRHFCPNFQGFCGGFHRFSPDFQKFCPNFH